MPLVLAVLFWIWFLVSVVVLVRRRLDRRAPATVLDHEAAITPTSDDEPLAMASAVADAPTVTVPAAATPAAPAPAPAPTIAEVPLPPGMATRPTADRRTARRGPPAAGVAEALVGIRMPCDLVPLVFDRLATDKIALSTVGHRADEVGTALADELERLGYVLKAVSDRQLNATRGATTLSLTIDAPGVDGRHAEHPNARDDAVVVEITLH